MSPTHAPILAPSLLAGDHANLAASARLVADLGLTWLHCDIMDGHFVPNLTFGPETFAALRRAGINLFFDTHLMLAEPHRYVEAFAKTGSNLISIHIEPACDHTATLAHIRALGCLNGLVLNPGTPVAAVEPFLAQVDLVLVMTVQPGFGGQPFRRDLLPKLAQLDTWRRERALHSASRSTAGLTLRPAGNAGRPARTPSWRAPRSTRPTTPGLSRRTSPASRRRPR